jgi:transposase InsO family protein
VIRTPVRAPNANAHIERWVGSARRECLDRILICNRRQLERVLNIYIRHYNERRPHRALDYKRLTRAGGLRRTASPRPRRFDVATYSADSSTNTKPSPREAQ